MFVLLCRFIRPNFVYWSVVRTTYDEEEDDDDDYGGSSDEDIDCKRENTTRDWDAMAGSYEEHDIDLDEFDHSLNKMSITPNNSLSHRFGGGEFMVVPRGCPQESGRPLVQNPCDSTKMLLPSPLLRDQLRDHQMLKCRGRAVPRLYCGNRARPDIPVTLHSIRFVFQPSDLSFVFLCT